MTGPAAGSTAPQFPPAGLNSVKAYRDAADPDLEALFSAIQDIRAVINTLRSFVESLDLGAGAIVDEALRDLLDLLALNYIRLRQPRLYFTLQAVSFAEEFTSVYGGEFNGISSVPRAFKKLWEFVTSPSRWFITIATASAPNHASTMPTIAPATPRIADSVTTSPKILRRLHPSTRRTAICRRRCSMEL